jgi:serine/threonine protein kinase
MCYGASPKCHCFVDLTKYGIDASGCILDNNWRDGLYVVKSAGVHSSRYENEYEYFLPVFEKSHGRHGIIEGGVLINKVSGAKKLVYSKSPQDKDVSLLNEAIIQIVVRESLVRGGFNRGVPEVYRVYGLEGGGVGFLMEPVEGRVLEEVLTEYGTIPSQILIECLFNIAAMLDWIVCDLGMNHRDLKPSNLILLEREVQYKKLKIGQKKYTIVSKFDIVFLDYGFSCIGNDISLGEIYGKDDPCVKEGRDLFMFLAFLYLSVHMRITADIVILFERWLTPGFCNLLRTSGQELDPVDYIYFMSGNQEIRRFYCTPEKIISDLLSIKA